MKEILLQKLEEFQKMQRQIMEAGILDTGMSINVRTFDDGEQFIDVSFMRGDGLVRVFDRGNVRGGEPTVCATTYSFDNPEIIYRMCNQITDAYEKLLQEANTVE